MNEGNLDIKSPKLLSLSLARAEHKVLANTNDTVLADRGR